MVSIIGMGDNVVDCYPALGRGFPGGNCLNVSVFAARAGARSAYRGAVGRDAAGAWIRRALETEGVDVAPLEAVPGRTAFCDIELAEGERTFGRQDPGVSRFRVEAADLARAAGYDAVHVGQSSGLDADIPRLAGVTRLSYDFSDRYDASRLSLIAPHCFLASLSARSGTVEEGRALARRALTAGADRVLVTLGADGAMLAGPGGPVVEPGRTCDVVDTLGAGDTCTAHVLVGLLAGRPPRRVLETAVRRAAETCGQLGAFGHPLTEPADLPSAGLPDAERSSSRWI